MDSSSFITFLLKYWQLVGFTGLVEILFFSSLLYSFSLWLKKDRHNNLVLSFYGYSSLALVAHAFHLPVIENFLFIAAPAAMMVFILIHQETLQKNYLTARNITPAVQPESDWLAILMRSFLISLNKNQSILCVVEKHDSLKTILQAPLVFNTPLHKDLLDVLLNSQLFDAQKMIWINHHGQLCAINAGWDADIDDTWKTKDVLDLEEWKQDALLLAHKTDALIFKISPATRTVDLVAQKRILDKVPINDAVATIKKYLYSTQSSPALFSDYDFIRGTHEAISKKSSRNQSIS